MKKNSRKNILVALHIHPVKTENTEALLNYLKIFANSVYFVVRTPFSEESLLVNGRQIRRRCAAHGSSRYDSIQ